MDSSVHLVACLIPERDVCFLGVSCGRPAIPTFKRVPPCQLCRGANLDKKNQH